MNENEEERSQSGHRAIIDDSWLRAREWIRKANAADVDPERALWPAGRQQRTRTHETALAAHAATIQFRDDISAYREQSGQIEVKEKWEKDVGSVTVDGKEFDISLATLDEWANERIQRERSEWDGVRGKQTQVQQFRVLLPIQTCQRLYRHMQDILHEVGFTAETRDVTYSDEASEEDLAYLLDQRGQEEAKGSLPARFTKGTDSS